MANAGSWAGRHYPDVGLHVAADQPGKTRSPPMSSAGGLFDIAGTVPSPTTKIFADDANIDKTTVGEAAIGQDASTAVIASSLASDWRRAQAR